MAAALSMKANFLISWLLLCIGFNAVAASQPEVNFTPIKFEQWQKRLDSYPPDIVVVDMWATWCASCIERFPKMIELHQRFKNQGVRFVSMCLDDHQDKPALQRAKKFLQKQNAVFENYWMNENLMATFDKLKLIGIPAVVIYDQQGNEAYRLSGDNPNKQFTDEDVEVAITALISNKKYN